MEQSAIDKLKAAFDELGLKATLDHLARIVRQAAANGTAYDHTVAERRACLIEAAKYPAK